MHTASNSYPAKIFREHATWVQDNFPDAKHIINHQVGLWGRRRERFTKVRSTNEWDTARAMVNQYSETATQKFMLSMELHT